jgi:hypothetical protein
MEELTEVGQSRAQDAVGHCCRDLANARSSRRRAGDDDLTAWTFPAKAQIRSAGLMTTARVSQPAPVLVMGHQWYIQGRSYMPNSSMERKVSARSNMQ